MAKTKALVLFSGGLDSLLAVKILEKQGIKATGITFESSFFNASKAREQAGKIKLPLIIVDISHEILDLVKNPQSGYGKYLNPCIDCHTLMIKKAKSRAKKEGFDIIATGEVLGQRPFSQNKEALNRVEKKSGAEVLRPLSALLLEPTRYEVEGLVKRKKLEGIKGRSRFQQEELAKKFRIKKYPNPGGGCMLTEKDFSDKLSQMLKNWPDCNPDDAELLKNGRNYWIYDKILLTIARNKEECLSLKKLARPGDILIEPEEKNGPLSLLRVLDFHLSIFGGEVVKKIPIPKNLKIEKLNSDKEMIFEEILELSCVLTGWHGPRLRGREANFKLKEIN